MVPIKINSNSILNIDIKPLQHLTFKESSLKKFEQNLMNNFQYLLNRYITKLLSRVNEVIKSFPN